MKTIILREAGHEEALFGLSLSFYDHKIPAFDNKMLNMSSEELGLSSCRLWQNQDKFFWTDEKYERAKQRARKLAFMQGGHNKFLESIVVWGYIQAVEVFGKNSTLIELV